jgi:hypothetical protein
MRKDGNPNSNSEEVIFTNKYLIFYTDYIYIQKSKDVGVWRCKFKQFKFTLLSDFRTFHIIK